MFVDESMLKVCSKQCCKRLFSVDDPRKTCPKCREIVNACNAKPERKAAKALYRKSEKGRTATQRANHGPNAKANRRRYRLTDKGKATVKRQNAKLSSRLSQALSRMVAGKHQNPVSLPSLGVFVDNSDAQAHFVSTFEPWMTMENQGEYRSGDDYNVKWNIGHRLPRSIFDSANIEDVRRCWSRENLFAQCARANVENWKLLTHTDAELLALQALWPTAAKDLQGLKALF